MTVSRTVNVSSWPPVITTESGPTLTLDQQKSIHNDKWYCLIDIEEEKEKNTEPGLRISYREILECRYLETFQSVEEYIVSNLQYRVSSILKNCDFFFSEFSPKIPKIRREFQKFQKFSENSPKIPKNRQNS